MQTYTSSEHHFVDHPPLSLSIQAAVTRLAHLYSCTQYSTAVQLPCVGAACGAFITIVIIIDGAEGVACGREGGWGWMLLHNRPATFIMSVVVSMLPVTDELVAEG